MSGKSVFGALAVATALGLSTALAGVGPAEAAARHAGHGGFHGGGHFAGGGHYGGRYYAGNWRGNRWHGGYYGGPYWGGPYYYGCNPFAIIVNPWVCG